MRGSKSPTEEFMSKEFISPKQAAAWVRDLPEYQLGRLSPNFTKYQDAMARDMARGIFPLTHQPIAIDTDGKLLDGLQRCSACAKADVGFTTWVAWNCDPSSYRYVDRGIRRRVDLPIDRAAIGRALLNYPDGFAKYQTDQEIIDVVQRHDDHCTRVLRDFQKVKGVRPPAQVKAAIVRAMYEMDMDQYQRLRSIVIEGVNGSTQRNGDVSAFSLRDYLLGKCRSSGRVDNRYVIYAKAERALRAFIEGRNIGRLVPGDMAEVFPLPEEALA